MDPLLQSSFVLGTLQKPRAVSGNDNVWTLGEAPQEQRKRILSSVQFQVVVIYFNNFIWLQYHLHFHNVE